MKFLVDTHALVWWLLDDPRLSPDARSAIATETTVFVSPVSAFEIVTKVRLGKFEEARRIDENFSYIIDSQNFERLPIDERHALAAGKLAGNHRDPFDRFLAAQAILENLTLITRDPAFAGFDVETLW